MAIAEYIGLNNAVIADNSLCRISSAIDLRRNRFDNMPREPGRRCAVNRLSLSINGRKSGIHNHNRKSVVVNGKRERESPPAVASSRHWLPRLSAVMSRAAVELDSIQNETARDSAI